MLYDSRVPGVTWSASEPLCDSTSLVVGFYNVPRILLELSQKGHEDPVEESSVPMSMHDSEVSVASNILLEMRNETTTSAPGDTDGGARGPAAAMRKGAKLSGRVRTRSRKARRPVARKRVPNSDQGRRVRVKWIPHGGSLRTPKAKMLWYKGTVIQHSKTATLRTHRVLYEDKTCRWHDAAGMQDEGLWVFET